MHDSKDHNQRTRKLKGLRRKHVQDLLWCTHWNTLPTRRGTQVEGQSASLNAPSTEEEEKMKLK